MTAETASVQFIGTATVLVRYADPNFLHRGERAYLGYGLTAKRLTEPALDVTELPPLDGAVLSHLHGDHDYSLFTSPLSEFTEEMTRCGLTEQLRVVGRGETLDLGDLVRG